MLDKTNAFPLAPMTRGLRIMTWFLMALPTFFLVMACLPETRLRGTMAAMAALVMLVYVSVWFLFRPTRFEIDATGLWIVWPMRSRHIPRREIGEASAIGIAEFKREYGLGMRVGAGGLWGGFGLLKTGRETFSMWISRTDAFVLVRLRGARTLLITPDRPREFLEALGELQRRNDERATPLGSTASG